MHRLRRRGRQARRREQDVTPTPHRWMDSPTLEVRQWQRCTRCLLKRVRVCGVRGGLTWEYWRPEPGAPEGRWAGTLPPDCLPADEKGKR